MSAKDTGPGLAGPARGGAASDDLPADPDDDLVDQAGEEFFPRQRPALVDAAHRGRAGGPGAGADGPAARNGYDLRNLDRAILSDRAGRLDMGGPAVVHSVLSE